MLRMEFTAPLPRTEDSSMIQIAARKKPVSVQKSSVLFLFFQKTTRKRSHSQRIDAKRLREKYPHFYNMASISAKSTIEAIISAIGSLPYRLY